MTRNLREIILNRIAEIIRREDYEDLDAAGRKRPALEELEVLNRLLQNISETDLVNIPDNKREDIAEGNVYKISDGNNLIAGCIRVPEVPTPCSKCTNYLESLRTGKTLVCNCTLGLPSITCNYEYKSNIE